MQVLQARQLLHLFALIKMSVQSAHTNRKTNNIMTNSCNMQSFWCGQANFSPDFSKHTDNSKN